MKIVDLLKTLSILELKRFEKFLESPYHNENEGVIKVFKEFLEPQTSKEFIDHNSKKKIIELSNWNDLKFRKLCNEVLELLLEFQTIENRKSNLFTNRLTIYRTILDKKWNNKLSHRLSAIDKEKVKKESWTEIELAEYYIFLKSKIDSDLFDPEEALLIYAEIAQIKKEFLRCSDISSFLDLNNLAQANYHLDGTTYKSISTLENDLYPIYRHVKKLFEGDNYHPILNSIKGYLSNSQINGKLKYRLLVHCIGYMTTLLNKGDTKVNSEIFKLYKFGIDKNILEIEVVDYRNIAYFACQMKEFEWALDFVEKYKSKLPLEEQESAYSFTKARTLWYAEKWEGVIQTLRNVEYKDMTYNLLARSYILTCYFELDDFEPLDSLIKSFKVYLRRKRNVSKARKESFYNFITVLDHLMKASERNDYKRINKAKEVIENNPSTRNKDWLNEKIEELEAVISKSKK